MHRRSFLHRTSLGLIAVTAGGPALVHAAPPKPRLTVKGALLGEHPFLDFETDGWSKGRGRWKIDKGELTGEQIDPEPLYHAHVHHAVDFGPAAIIEAEVKLDGANACWFGLGGVGAFLMSDGRISFHEDGAEMRGAPGVPGADNQVRRGKWYPVLVEFAGMEAAGEREKTEIATEATLFKQKRSGFSFVVASDVEKGGGSASLRNLKFWHATPNEKWKKPKTPRQR